MGAILLSFKLNMADVLQYGFNIFGSFLPLVYLFAGAAFALFIIFAVIDKVRGKQ
ncbi:hypothetical protein D3C74_186420 [compost metagenome]